MEIVEIIKKHPNRKLYSTKISSYIPLSYILDLVNTKQKFQVIDNKSKLDITTKTIRASMADLPLSLETMIMLIRGN